MGGKGKGARGPRGPGRKKVRVEATQQPVFYQNSLSGARYFNLGAHFLKTSYFLARNFPGISEGEIVSSLAILNLERGSLFTRGFLEQIAVYSLLLCGRRAGETVQ